jgi:uncharacterized membrane protein
MVSEAAAGAMWWAVVVLGAAAIYTVFGTTGSLIRSRAITRTPRGSTENDYWIFGFYNNPDDDNIFVKNRSLPQLTTNLGHPVGFVVMLLALLVLVVIDVLLIVTSM